MTLLRLLRSFLRPHHRLLLAVVVFQLCQAVASLYLPTLNAVIIDDGIAKGDIGLIVAIGVLMLLITLAQVACSVTAVYFGAKVAMRLGRDLRGAVFGRVGEFSEREVTRFGAPSLITRTTNDVQQVQMLVLMTCTILVSAPFLAVGGVAMALQQDVQLSWLIAVSVPVLVGALALVLVKVFPLFRIMQQRIDWVNRVLREQLTGIRVVRAFVREDVEARRFGDANEELTRVALAVGRLFALTMPIVTLVLFGSSVAVIWFGAFRIEEGSMQVGSLTAFLSYLMQILMAVMMVTFMSMMVPRAAVCAERIDEVLRMEPSVLPPRHAVTNVRERGTAEFRRVDFAHPGAEKPVLSDVSFRIEPGTTTAIVGSTGSGKTTLVGLLPRLFDVTSGAVLVDGVDVTELDPELLWSSIGFVPQRAYLFSGTIASNLRYGNPDASDEELWRALEIAQARDFVASMPQGLATTVAQGGTDFSGGQRQRLAIARALVKRPELYVFDDSFSALDLATDARLREALRRHETDTSMVIVAQRVSTIVDADQIVVLESGRVVGIGTHEQLLETCATYEEIVSSQASVQEAS